MVVVARLLTPSDLGLMAILLVFTSIGTVLVESGLGMALIQRQRCTDDDETTVFSFAVMTSMVLATTLLIAAPGVASFFDEPRLTPLLRAASVMFPLAALGTVPDALLTMRLDFKARTKAQFVASLISGALAVSLAWIGWGVWALVAQLVVASAARTAMVWVSSRWRPRGRFRRGSLKTLGRFGAFMLSASLLNAVFTRLQSLVLGKLFDTNALGYYALADTTRQAPANFVTGVLGRVGLPSFSALAHDRTALREALRVALRVSMFIFVPCMVMIAVLAEPLITMVYGDRWLPAAPVLSIMAIATALWPLHVLNIAALNAQGRSDLTLRIELVKDGMSLLYIVVGSPWGGVGLASALLAASITAHVVNAYYTKKLLDFGAVSQCVDQGATFLLTGMSASVAWLILAGIGITPFNTALALVSGIVVYLGSAVMVRPMPVQDVLRLATTVRGAREKVYEHS